MSVKNLWNTDAARDCGLATCACLTHGKTPHASLAALEPRGLRAIEHGCWNVWEGGNKAVEHAWHKGFLVIACALRAVRW